MAFIDEVLVLRTVLSARAVAGESNRMEALALAVTRALQAEVDGDDEASKLYARCAYHVLRNKGDKVHDVLDKLEDLLEKRRTHGR